MTENTTTERAPSTETMEDIDALLAAELKQAQEEAKAEADVPVRIALWPNGKRREGKTDPHFTGTVEIDASEMGRLCAQALERGEAKFRIYADVWHQKPEAGKSGGAKPSLSGKARNLVGAKSEADTAPEAAPTGT